MGASGSQSQHKQNRWGGGKGGCKGGVLDASTSAPPLSPHFHFGFSRSVKAARSAHFFRKTKKAKALTEGERLETGGSQSSYTPGARRRRLPEAFAANWPARAAFAIADRRSGSIIANPLGTLTRPPRRPSSTAAAFLRFVMPASLAQPQAVAAYPQRDRANDSTEIDQKAYSLNGLWPIIEVSSGTAGRRTRPTPAKV
jgi:hypothetical protein